MPRRFHASLEGAQHGDKNLKQLIAFAKAAGCQGVQPSNYHLQNPDGTMMKASEVRDAFTAARMSLDGISMHCPFWVHTTAWTGSLTIRPFLPPHVARESPEKIEAWTEEYCINVLNLASDLKIRTVPMFWGVAFGWEAASGYPWGFYSGCKGELHYDLIEEGKERFAKKTERLRTEARSRGISLAHEIHPGTAASCADDFLMLVDICDGDKSLGVNADPSHCWAGEDWFTRFTKVGSYITGCHVKDHYIQATLPLLSMQSDWKKRGMRFTRLGDGQIPLLQYVQLMDTVGYTDRYCEAHKTQTAPAVGEAEEAYAELDETSAHASGYINSNLCLNHATKSFEEGMGE